MTLLAALKSFPPSFTGRPGFSPDGDALHDTPQFRMDDAVQPAKTPIEKLEAYRRSRVNRLLDEAQMQANEFRETAARVEKKENAPVQERTMVASLSGAYEAVKSAGEIADVAKWAMSDKPMVIEMLNDQREKFEKIESTLRSGNDAIKGKMGDSPFTAWVDTKLNALDDMIHNVKAAKDADEIREAAGEGMRRLMQ